MNSLRSSAWRLCSCADRPPPERTARVPAQKTFPTTAASWRSAFSALVWELYRRVDAEPELITWRQGRSLPYGEGVTFWALGEMVKAQAGILETDESTQFRR
jgi:hypothetical protein